MRGPVVKTIQDVNGTVVKLVVEILQVVIHIFLAAGDTPAYYTLVDWKNALQQMLVAVGKVCTLVGSCALWLTLKVDMECKLKQWGLQGPYYANAHERHIVEGIPWKQLLYFIHEWT